MINILDAPVSKKSNYETSSSCAGNNSHNKDVTQHQQQYQQHHQQQYQHRERSLLESPITVLRLLVIGMTCISLCHTSTLIHKSDLSFTTIQMDSPTVIANAKNKPTNKPSNMTAEDCEACKMMEQCYEADFCTLRDNATGRENNFKNDSALQKSQASKSLETGVAYEFVLPPSEWIEDISTFISCGGVKCAFHSNISQYNGHRDQYGYVVAQASKKHPRPFDNVDKAAELAQNLSEMFPIRHLVLGRPRRLNITKEQKIRKGLRNLYKGIGRKRRVKFRPTTSSNLENTQLIVQPIKVVPEDFLMFGCFPEKREYARVKLAAYAANTTSLPAAKLQEMKEQIKFDLNVTDKMIKSKIGSCLSYDFQVFIDPDTGKIYHFDIDRCSERPGGNKGWSTCKKVLKKFLYSLVKHRAEF